MYPIEDIAGRTGLTKRTIRYYEEIGILPPPERTPGGHRVYTDGHLKVLDQIIFLKETLGLSLGDMKAHLAVRQEVDSLVPALREASDSGEKRDHLNRIRDLLMTQASLIEGQLARLLEAKKENERLVERVDQGLKNLVP